MLAAELFDAVLKFSASEGLCIIPLTGPPTVDPDLEADDDLELESPTLNLSIAAILTIVTVETRAPAALPAESSGSTTSNAMELLLKLSSELCLLVLNREFLAVFVRGFLLVSTGEFLLVFVREFLVVLGREILVMFAQEDLLVSTGEVLLVFARVEVVVLTGDVCLVFA